MCCEIIRQRKVKKLRNRKGKVGPPIQICLVAFEAFIWVMGRRVMWIGLLFFPNCCLGFFFHLVYSIFVLVRVFLLLLFVFSCVSCFSLACEGKKLGWCGREMYLDLLIWGLRSSLNLFFVPPLTHEESNKHHKLNTQDTICTRIILCSLQVGLENDKYIPATFFYRKPQTNGSQILSFIP